MNFILKICLPISFIYHSGCMHATMLPNQLKPYLLLSPFSCAYSPQVSGCWQEL